MPAAAVIPAPIAYIKVVAVKKLVVEFLGRAPVHPLWCALGCLVHFCGVLPGLDWFGWYNSPASITVNKLECLRRALA